MAYWDRVVDHELRDRLMSAGAVVIEGPKAVGKTATARQHAASEVLLDVDDNARRAIALDPALVLSGDVPRLIDEWQVEPAVWNHIRRAVDDRGAPGQFILTGSANPADDITRHSGAGRLVRLRMRPMSLYETGHSIGTVSLSGALEGEGVRSPSPKLSFTALVDRIVTGGWPVNLTKTVPQAQQVIRGYLDEVCRIDIRRVDGVARDPVRVERVLRSLARNVATEVATTTLALDAGGPDGPLKDDTVSGYLDALERLMVIEEQPAWAPHLRSRSILRRSAKRHFVDPSLAAGALRATPQRLLADLNLLGLLFESLVVRDLRVYAQAADGRVLHYRDNTGLEIDIIVELADGRWGAFEVKLGGDQAIEQAAETLTRFAQRVDTSISGEPAVLAVITATGFGYMRNDGVGVIPVGALAP